MLKTEIHSKLGEGIYSVSDISFLLKLPKAKVRRWLNTFWNDRFAQKYNTEYSWGVGRAKATNFHILIEFYVFYQLREAGVSVSTIVTAHEEMAKKFKTPYPFASARLLTDGKNILYSIQDGTTVRANKSKQIVFREIIEDFYKRIDFSEDQLAERFYPLGKDHHIVVDPSHQFGQPTVENTNILAQTIYDMHRAGESDEFLARLYDLPLSSVEAAISLFNPQAA